MQAAKQIASKSLRPKASLDDIQKALRNSKPPKSIFQSIISFPNNIFKRHIADPIVRHGNGLSKWFNYSSYCVKIKLHALVSGEKITTRSDICHVDRTFKDSLIAVPSAFFMFIPVVLPIFEYITYRFPRLCPSSFLTQEKLDHLMQYTARNRESLKPTILSEMRKGIDEIVRDTPNDREIQYAGKLWKIMMSKYSANPAQVSMIDISKLAPIFRARGLFNSPTSQVYNWARYLGFNALFFKTKLYRWADWNFKDTDLILADSVTVMTTFELLEALSDRGYASELVDADANTRKLLLAHCQFSKVLAQDACRRNAKATEGSGVILAGDVGAAVPMLILARVMGISK